MKTASGRSVPPIMRDLRTGKFDTISVPSVWLRYVLPGTLPKEISELGAGPQGLENNGVRIKNHFLLSQLPLASETVI